MSKSQPASPRSEDPHESATIAPPAPRLGDFLSTPPAGPPRSTPGDDPLEAALDAGALADVRLSQLAKMAAQLANGVAGARQTNEQLLHELSTLRLLLGSTAEQQLGLSRRVAELEQELLAARAEAEREQRFLTDQHDEFIAALVEEHEQALAAQQRQSEARHHDDAELARKLAQAETARAQAEAECERARQALAKALAQRDEAQARAEKRERERDELRAEASQLRTRLGTHRSVSTLPPPAVSPRPPSYRPPPALQLDTGELDSALHAHLRLPAPQLSSAALRHTPPPAELQRSLYAPRSLNRPPSVEQAERASEFPRVSTRPGVGGPKPTEPPPPPDFGPPPAGFSAPAPAAAPQPITVAPPRPRTVSAASLPPETIRTPPLKQKPDPTTRPLISYSIGQDVVESETLEGVRLSSKPPRK